MLRLFEFFAGLLVRNPKPKLNDYQMGREFAISALRNVEEGWERMEVMVLRDEVERHRSSGRFGDFDQGIEDILTEYTAGIPLAYLVPNVPAPTRYATGGIVPSGATTPPQFYGSDGAQLRTNPEPEPEPEPESPRRRLRIRR